MSETHEKTVVEARWAKALRVVGVPLISVVLATLIGSLIIWVSGYDPVAAFRALLQGSLGGQRQISETLLRATPLIFTGLAVGFGFRANLFNIGAEGQYIMGSLGAAWLGLLMSGLPTPVAVPLVLIGAALFGAAWAFIPALLKAKVGAHEVITTMMFSWIGLYLSSWIVSGPLRDVSAIPQTKMLPENLWLASFDKVIPGLIPMRAHLGFVLAIVMAVVVLLVLRRTTLGYNIRAVGFNPGAAESGGISIARTTVYALCISGALAGLAGASEVLGTNHRMFDQVSAGSGFGFTGIAVALLAKNHPIGVIFAALLFGVLQAGAGTMQLETGISVLIVQIIQGLVIFFVAAETIITWFIARRQKLKVEREEVVDAG